MNSYPDCETYKALYKRFFDGRRPEELIELAGDIKDKAVLDLCAGNGRLTLDAIVYGARMVLLVEKEEKMISPAVFQAKNIAVLVGDAEHYLKKFATLNMFFDFVFCQQAVNYWLNETVAKPIADVLTKNGLFIFNTFNQKPSEKPTVKEYELNGKKFVETSWLVGEVVHHVQIREGMEPHTTSFQWLSPEYLEKILSPYFSIEVKNEGASSLYRCSRK